MNLHQIKGSGQLPFYVAHRQPCSANRCQNPHSAFGGGHHVCYKADGILVFWCVDSSHGYDEGRLYYDRLTPSGLDQTERCPEHRGSRT